MHFINVLSASTQNLSEKIVQKLMDNGAPKLLLPELLPAETTVHHNGAADLELYSDQEEGKNQQYVDGLQ